LECAISGGVEYRVVDYDAIYVGILIRVSDLVFQSFSIDFAEREVEATDPALVNVALSRDWTGRRYLSLQVFAVHSAYIFAAGSRFARKPCRRSGRSSRTMPSRTSVNRLFAIEPASTTLQDDGAFCVDAFRLICDEAIAQQMLGRCKTFNLMHLLNLHQALNIPLMLIVRS